MRLTELVDESVKIQECPNPSCRFSVCKDRKKKSEKSKNYHSEAFSRKSGDIFNFMNTCFSIRKFLADSL